MHFTGTSAQDSSSSAARSREKIQGQEANQGMFFRDVAAMVQGQRRKKVD